MGAFSLIVVINLLNRIKQWYLDEDQDPEPATRANTLQQATMARARSMIRSTTTPHTDQALEGEILRKAWVLRMNMARKDTDKLEQLKFKTTSQCTETYKSRS